MSGRRKFTLHVPFSFVDNECIASVSLFRILLIIVPDDAYLQ